MKALVKRRWRRAGRAEADRTETFLKDYEYYCVTACAKFLNRQSAKDHVWHLTDQEGTVSALLLHYGRALLPVFGKTGDIPLPHFMKNFLGRIPIHAVQGLLKDAAILENAMENLGYQAKDRRTYDLMALDKAPAQSGSGEFPPGLILRRPEFTDMDALFPLQAGYEQEEVLPKGAEFNAALCRLTLSRILSNEQALIACMDGRVVGKINTNAAAFSRTQIGGVYVLPEYRGRGIAGCMTTRFAGELIAQGRGITLFVKKENVPARAAYQKAGFSAVADYRISYYQ
ncbi:acetyltransferase, GNAT family [Treponema primitia ZAS-2]|uniref:Acetyltransferase, GNAT family n=1 Tax=Treponema primitia (strain ATCC BAA-887 / DSM 12427 / ZAS-2) TaxID=545694 RepID=F5YP21_TREPZ|nr:GNAT family N-acetyltransferase [Treponema primitia]AEF86453.1 acetyltransferase, GNAT family [Treponema primitia ZAS-2]